MNQEQEETAIVDENVQNIEGSIKSTNILDILLKRSKDETGNNNKPDESPLTVSSSLVVGEIKLKKKTEFQELEELRKKQNEEVLLARTTNAEKKLNFIQEQVELFSNFNGNKKKPKKETTIPSKNKKRMTEKQGDNEFLVQQSEDSDSFLEQPSYIVGGQMRSYQLEGLSWMLSLYDRGASMILADEMGLGKTLQAISLLAYLKNDRNINGPHLVLVPLAVLNNWTREFERWCPSLRVVSIYGDAEERSAQIKNKLRPKQFDVVITTFEMLRLEKTKFKKFQFEFIVVDEAHRLKNDESLLSQTVREIDSSFRLLITGTPLQNNLRELWALLNFLIPDIFADASLFEDFFSLEELKEDRNASKLHGILTPFMLRRLKQDAEKDLPPKTEIKLYTGMTELQEFWYKSVLSRNLELLNQLSTKTSSKSLQNILMHLRKCCNHPYLFEGAEAGPPFIEGSHLYENSGKMVLLDKLLRKLKENGDRVLIFSQMTRMLDILEDYMILKQYSYCRLDGSTDERDRIESIDEFNKKDSEKFVFLLSTRAGGLGINLQTANVVIIYDSDWNPQVDLQAQDRAHRIGQTKEVKVFRFITEGTVEEKIIERADQKLYLDAVVVQQGRLRAAEDKNLNKDSLSNIVRFGADTIFRSGGTKVSDEDIDAILERGKSKTEELKSKLQINVQHSIESFEIKNTHSAKLTAPKNDSTTLSRPLLTLGKRVRKQPTRFSIGGKYQTFEPTKRIKTTTTTTTEEDIQVEKQQDGEEIEQVPLPVEAVVTLQEEIVSSSNLFLKRNLNKESPKYNGVSAQESASSSEKIIQQQVPPHIKTFLDSNHNGSSSSEKIIQQPTHIKPFVDSKHNGSSSSEKIIQQPTHIKTFVDSAAKRQTKLLFPTAVKVIEHCQHPVTPLNTVLNQPTSQNKVQVVDLTFDD